MLYEGGDLEGDQEGDFLTLSTIEDVVTVGGALAPEPEYRGMLPATDSLNITEWDA
jgi:hypothetical protein